jgi:Ca-activated chloride channel homolog
MRLRIRTQRYPAPAHVAVAIIALAIVSSAAADQPRRLPTFTSNLDVVNLNVSVTDAKDRYVTGLAAGDFQVFEDGVPQQLCLFTQERLPISLAVLIDSSMSMQSNLPAVRMAALRLLHALKDQDTAEVVQFNHNFRVLQDFTNDQGLLDKAVESIHADGATGLYNALYVTLKDPRFRRQGDTLTRQAIVVLSDGEDTSSLVSDDQVLQIARKGEVTIFAINLRAQRPVGIDTDAPDRASFFLTALARETGGRAYFPSALSQLDGVYDKIADELRTQYALGYVSNNMQRDGKWRKIAIATANGHLLLRHRLGYYAGHLRAAQAGGTTGTTATPVAATAPLAAAATLPRRQQTP